MKVRPHIKTNLYHLENHLDTIRDFDVSISGSLDLPLSMHDEYRVTKGGKGTLETILKNVELLAQLPNRKKVSSTIFQEHFQRLDEMVEDIKYLAENTCLDMYYQAMNLPFQNIELYYVDLNEMEEMGQFLLSGQSSHYRG